MNKLGEEGEEGDNLRRRGKWDVPNWTQTQVWSNPGAMQLPHITPQYRGQLKVHRHLSTKCCGTVVEAKHIYSRRGGTLHEESVLLRKALFESKWGPIRDSIDVCLQVAPCEIKTKVNYLLGTYFVSEIKPYLLNRKYVDCRTVWKPKR